MKETSESHLTWWWYEKCILLLISLCVWTKKHYFNCANKNIFWVFFTLLFNPTHPNQDPPTNQAVPLHKFCQNQCNAILTSLRYLKPTRFGQLFSFIHSFPTTLTQQGLFLVGSISRAWKTFLFYAKHQGPQIPTYIHRGGMCWLVCAPPQSPPHITYYNF